MDPLESTSLFEFSPSALFAGLIFGVIGWWVFGEGRRNARLPWVFIGLALMVYPYFTKGPIADWGIGVLLCGAAYYFRYA